MPLQIVPTKDGDMLRQATIEREAYKPAPASEILFPSAQLAPNVLDIRAEDLRAELQDAHVVSYKVVDTDIEGDASQQAIAFATWFIHDQDHPVVPKQPRPLPQGANQEACALLYGGLAKMKAKYIGNKPHIYLQSVRTDPNQQRRGAGSLLVKKCIEDSERRKLPIYLDSSVPGHRLYLSHGFHDVGECVTDFGKWGLEEPHWNWAMIREP